MRKSRTHVVRRTYKTDRSLRYGHPLQCKEGHSAESGFVITPRGVVGYFVYGKYGHEKDSYTRLLFSENGNIHEKNFERVFSDRRLVTEASDFALEKCPYSL